MSNLISSKHEIIKISDALDRIYSKGYNKETIERILEDLILENDQYIIDYQVTDGDDKFQEPAVFVPDENVLKISLNVLKNYLLEQTKDLRFAKEDETELREELFKRMVVYTILHENEHLKQYYIAQEFIDCPYKTVINLYKNMFEFKLENDRDSNDSWKKLQSDLNDIRKIMFYMSPHRYSHKFFLERNANVVAYDAMMKVCEYQEDLTFLPFFKHQKLMDMANGYQGIWNGPAERSYHKFHMGKTFNNLLINENIPEDDRVCYGLPLDIKTRIKVVNKKFKI